MLIKKTTKLLGDPCHSITKAYKINRVFDDFLRVTKIWHLMHRIEREISTRRHGPFTCGRRRESWHAGSQKKNADYWQKRGKDLCCSYCGSMKPEQFVAHCERVVALPDIDVRVGTTDKKYKYYVERPRIPNADYGATKFYMQHAPMHETIENNYDHAFIDKLNQAIQTSTKKFNRLLNNRDTRFQ